MSDKDTPQEEHLFGGKLTHTQIKEMVKKTPPSGPKRGIIFMAVVATLGSFCFGYDTSVIAGGVALHEFTY